MKLTGLDVFDSTIERTGLWLKDLMQELNWTDRRKAYLALRLVLQGLRDHLPVEQVALFGNQLPMLVRGFYFENWDPVGKPLSWKSRDDLLQGVSGFFAKNGDGSQEAEIIVRGVFRLLEKKAAEGEIQDLHDILPPDLQELWPPTLRAA